MHLSIAFPQKENVFAFHGKVAVKVILSSYYTLGQTSSEVQVPVVFRPVGFLIFFSKKIAKFLTFLDIHIFRLLCFARISREFLLLLFLKRGLA